MNLAYFNYKLNDVFTLSGGKMNNPFYRPAKNPILWDGDLNPEGFSLNFNNDFFQASLVGFSVEERKSADDTLLFGGQIMHGFSVSDTSKLTAGLGYYDYQDLQGNSPLFAGKSRGNTLDSNGNIANDFDIAEAFLEYKTTLASRPLSVYSNYYQNTAADDLDTAYTLGFMYGKVKGSGSWNFGYAYLDVEADAVFGLFNDSDFAGGNTDSKGHIIKAGYGLKKNMALSLTYIDSEMDQSKAQQTDYDRLQLDFKVKFK
ncbi:MAG: putative porin [Alcanivoracaceae bacterium]|nr:putative porin [Alcanivoracaceae bacterium]